MDLSNIKTINRQKGRYFFDPGAMRGFRSRPQEPWEGPGGIYFVDSIQFEPGYPRQYKVCAFDPDTGVVKVGDEFNTSAKANKEAKRLAEGV